MRNRAGDEPDVETFEHFYFELEDLNYYLNHRHLLQYSLYSVHHQFDVEVHLGQNILIQVES